MSPNQTGNVSITAEPNTFIRGQVVSGHYQNASEVVWAGLRLLMWQDQCGWRKQLAAGADPING